MMILIAYAKAKPTFPVDTTVNVPAMVNNRIFRLMIVPVKVTMMFAGIVIEQLPKGTMPPDHVVESVNAPD